MKKKIVMYGIGNDDKLNYYIFEKTQKAFEALIKLFNKNLKINWQILMEEHVGNEIKEKKLLVKNFTDTHQSHRGKSRLDIFYGKKKMFFTLHCSEKIRDKINEDLGKIATMPKGIK